MLWPYSTYTMATCNTHTYATATISHHAIVTHLCYGQAYNYSGIWPYSLRHAA